MSISFKGRKTRLVVDVIALCAFLASSLSEDLLELHIAASVLFVAAVSVHLSLNANWIVRMHRVIAGKVRHCSVVTKTNYYNDLLILATFVLSSVSGFVMMFADTVQISKTHSSTSLLFILGSLVHVGLHWRWFVPRSFRNAMTSLRAGTGRTEADADGAGR